MNSKKFIWKIALAIISRTLGWGWGGGKVGEGTEGDPPPPPPSREKLACTPMPPLLCPQNVDFVIFIQFWPFCQKCGPISQIQLEKSGIYDGAIVSSPPFKLGGISCFWNLDKEGGHEKIVQK